MFTAASQIAGYKPAGHRLKVYVSLAGCRRKPSDIYTRTKNHAQSISLRSTEQSDK
jgi:hypothetical protein